MSRVTGRRPNYLIAAASLLAGAWSVPAAAQEVFLEQDGIVAIEAESATAVPGWETHAPAVANIRGEALLSTGGDSICSSNTNKAKDFAPLDYHFRISKAGTYRLRLNIHKQVHCVDVGDPSQLAACHDGAKCVSHGVQSDGDSCASNRCWRSDVSNDAFVNIVTAEGAPLKWVGGTTDITKLYGGSGSNYAWSGNNALDHGGSKHAPDWDLSAGDYVLEVRNRSNGFSFDRLILVEASASDADAKSAPESPVAQEPMPGTGGMSGNGTGGADSTGGANSDGADGSGGTDSTPGATGGAASGGSQASGGATLGSGGLSPDEMNEGTGSGDESPATSGDEGSCSWSVSTPNHSWLIASLFLLALAVVRRSQVRRGGTVFGKR